MTFLKHDPTTFADAAATGFASVHAGQVTAVPGGILRATRGTDDEVAVIIGGLVAVLAALLLWGAARDGALVGPGAAMLLLAVLSAVIGSLRVLSGQHDLSDVLAALALSLALSLAGYLL